MSDIAIHLVRRGLDATQRHYAKFDQDGNKYSISVWGAMLLVATTLIFMAAMLTVRYRRLESHCGR